MAAVKRHPQRGRITTEAVVDAAVRIVDRLGHEALTIRRLADTCGLSPMGIYRYVRSRDELLDLVVERILEELPERAPAGTWTQRAARLFRGFRRMALRHPGVAALGVSRVTPVAAMALFTDRALGIFDDAGFAADDAVMAYDALLMFTIGSIVWQVPRTGAERARLLQAVEPGTAPHLVRFGEPLARREPDRYFEFGLKAMLAGLGAGGKSPSRRGAIR